MYQELDFSPRETSMRFKTKITLGALQIMELAYYHLMVVGVSR